MIEKSLNNNIWFEFSLLQEFPISCRVFSLKSDTEDYSLVGKYISSKQVHGNKVCYAQPNLISDGLMTDQLNIGLLSSHADCQIAILYDPIHHVVANVHAGWRGQVQDIYKIAILEMQKKFSSSPKDLIVCISPSLGPKRSEFVHYETELPKHFWPFLDKYKCCNLWELSKWQLMQSGILEEHIEIAETCTYDNPMHFYSYRRDKTIMRNVTISTLL